jgi:hypothetical protein
MANRYFAVSREFCCEFYDGPREKLYFAVSHGKIVGSLQL